MNNVTRMPSLGAGRLAKSIPGTGSVMKLLLGDKSRVLTQPHLTATDSRTSTIQWIGFLNDLFYGRSYIAAPAEFQFLFCLMKNPLLYRSAWPESSLEASEG